MARFSLYKASLSKQVTTTLKRIIPSSVVVIMLALLLHLPIQKPKKSRLDPTLGYLPPLEMKGGDPYIRALMRTISASEANDPKPYSILYGGRQIEDLSRHPEQCITIVSVPNRGDCRAAAGRYQMINITWHEKAKLYHPQPPGLMFWKPYSGSARISRCGSLCVVKRSPILGSRYLFATTARQVKSSTKNAFGDLDKSRLWHRK